MKSVGKDWERWLFFSNAKVPEKNYKACKFKQENMAQLKDQNKTPEIDSKEMQIWELAAWQRI